MIEILKLKEEIGLQHIQKLKKEFGAWSKNVRNISSFKDIIVVWDAVQKWFEYFEEFVFANMAGLGKRGETSRDRARVMDLINEYTELLNFFYVGTYRSDKVIKDTTYVVTLERVYLNETKGVFFGVSGKEMNNFGAKYRDDDRIIEYLNNPYDICEHPIHFNENKDFRRIINPFVYTVAEREKTKTEPVTLIQKLYYDIWASARDGKYQKIARLGRNLFERIDTLFDNKATSDPGRVEGDFVPEKSVKDVIKQFGATITLIYAEYDKKEMDVFYQNLALAIRAVKDTGFARALDNLNVTADISIKNPEFYVKGQSYVAAGFYMTASGDILLFPTYPVGNMVSTLIHELGHKYYYEVMSKKGREIWDDFASKNMNRAVSDYGATNEREFFAEAFTLYVLAKSGLATKLVIKRQYKMDEDVLEFFIHATGVKR